MQKREKEAQGARGLVPTRIWDEYQRAIAYNDGIDLYGTVRQNEDFYTGDQWRGVYAPDLDKPVFNILKRIVSYFVSMLVSDDVAARVEGYPQDEEEGGGAQQALAQAGKKTKPGPGRLTGYINSEIERVIEDTKAKLIGRDALRDAAVDGDACIHLFFQTQFATASPLAQGAIRMEQIDNTQVLFGNPRTACVQEQPYIILPMRVPVSQARREARENGCDPDLIREDNGENDLPNVEHLPGGDTATVLVRYWRDESTGSIWCAKSTKEGFVRPPWDTELRLYPVAYFSWEKVKNSYHGRAAVTGLIPNQIAINKLYAMYMKSVRDNAFPITVYDSSKIHSWNPGPGKVIKAAGNPRESVLFASERLAETSNQAANVVAQIIGMTKDTMGASDAALGNVKPDNTSAIIAVQKASSAPLELQRMAYYQWIEDYVRIMLDMMRAYYGVRKVSVEGTDGQSVEPVDFGKLDNMHVKLKVNVGQSAYFSELMQLQTLDNLFMKGLIPDPVLYLEAIPEGYIRGKAKLIEALKNAKQEKEAGGGMGGGLASAMQALGGAGLPYPSKTSFSPETQPARQ